MEKTLVIFKPSAMERGCVGQILARFQQKGLIISGIKMMWLDEAILREHYSHLVEKPFFPHLLKAMMASPVIVVCLAGLDVVNVVRMMTGSTNGREAQWHYPWRFCDEQSGEYHPRLFNSRRGRCRDRALF